LDSAVILMFEIFNQLYRSRCFTVTVELVGKVCTVIFSVL